jgi:hypothetical protein
MLGKPQSQQILRCSREASTLMGDNIFTSHSSGKGLKEGVRFGMTRNLELVHIRLTDFPLYKCFNAEKGEDG